MGMKPSCAPVRIYIRRGPEIEFLSGLRTNYRTPCKYLLARVRPAVPIQRRAVFPSADPSPSEYTRTQFPIKSTVKQMQPDQLRSLDGHYGNHDRSRYCKGGARRKYNVSVIGEKKGSFWPLILLYCHGPVTVLKTTNLNSMLIFANN